MAVEKHVHKLRKHKYKTGATVYFCTLPDCHYKIDAPLSLGKESICNICGEPFIMNEYTLKLVKPHCQNCGRRLVRQPNGKRRYVRKQANRVLTDVSTENANELRERLSSVTSPPMEDDI